MPPAPEVIFQTLDATWPAARTLVHDGWTLREGQGGGQRVSAATARAPDAEIATAESGMSDIGQHPLFMVRPGEDALDADLAARGYALVDPVTIYAVESERIANHAGHGNAVAAWPPLAVQIEIWAEAGIGPARIAIMERATCERTTLLGRVADRPAATTYVGAKDGIAMLHALETRPELRRRGAGRLLMAAAAQWAVDQRADWLTLAVVTANAAANALYSALGMTPVTTYHYRRAPEVSA